jgi:hypothetical protein
VPEAVAAAAAAIPLGVPPAGPDAPSSASARRGPRIKRLLQPPTTRDRSRLWMARAIVLLTPSPRLEWLPGSQTAIAKIIPRVNANFESVNLVPFQMSSCCLDPPVGARANAAGMQHLSGTHSLATMKASQDQTKTPVTTCIPATRHVHDPKPWSNHALTHTCIQTSTRC